MVENPYEIEIVFTSVMPCEPHHCQEQGDSTAMTGKSTFPRHEYFPESLPASEIVIRLIEDTVAKTGTNDGSDQKCVEKRIQKCLRYILSSEKPPEDVPSQNETGNEQQSVPTQRKSSDMENLRIHAPMYCQCLKHSLFIFTTCKYSNKTKKQ